MHQDLAEYLQSQGFEPGGNVFLQNFKVLQREGRRVEILIDLEGQTYRADVKLSESGGDLENCEGISAVMSGDGLFEDGAVVEDEEEARRIHDSGGQRMGPFPSDFGRIIEQSQLDEEQSFLLIGFQPLHVETHQERKTSSLIGELHAGELGILTFLMEFNEDPETVAETIQDKAYVGVMGKLGPEFERSDGTKGRKFVKGQFVEGPENETQDDVQIVIDDRFAEPEE